MAPVPLSQLPTSLPLEDSALRYIASVITLYWRRFLEPVVLTKVLVAFIPTGIIAFALYRVVKTYFFDSDTVVLWALGLGGVALIVFELLHREKDDAVGDVASISYSKALLIRERRS
jgi:undecaprenyl-diphosphatase